MDVFMYQHKNYLWIQVPEELDQHVSDIIRRKCEILSLDFSFRHIVFDFTKTCFMDSSGIGLMLSRYQQISMGGGIVYAFCPGNRILKIMEMAGMLRMVKIINHVEELNA